MGNCAGSKSCWAITLAFAAWTALVTVLYFAQFSRLALALRRLLP